MASFNAKILFSLLFCAISCCNASSTITPQMNGENVEPMEFRNMAWIPSKWPNDVFDVCGGAIIDNRQILSSAICIKTMMNEDKEHQGITIYLGSQTDVNSEEAYKVTSEHVVYHPGISEVGFNDLAIIRIKEKINFSDTIVPILLPPFDVTNETGLSVLAAGFDQSYVRNNSFRICFANYNRIHCATT